MIETKMMSIGGYAFTMDAEAAAAAQKYISSLEKYYLKNESGREIMEGIEERMAELFLEKSSTGGVVSVAMVNEVIDIIGKPEVIEQESEASDGDGTKSHTYTTEGKEAPKKKLYRDLSNKIVGGVCSGLALYSGVDVVLFRLAFAILTVFPVIRFLDRSAFSLSAPAIYIILWISMPAARTVKQKWSQKGETGSLDDIQRVVTTPSKNTRKDNPAGHGLVRVIAILVGTIFLLTSVSGLSAGVAAAFFPGNFGLDNLYDYFVEELREVPGLLSVMDMPIVHILGFGAWFLPFIGLIYAAIMMIFGFKSPSWRPGLVIFILWLIVVAALASILSVSVLQYTTPDSVIQL
ncbi:MAG: PspC domain-containing protein [Bacteroidales bacterium]|nr:PspC domain-containing protein [Bacteroidales bacterium]